MKVTEYASYVTGTAEIGDRIFPATRKSIVCEACVRGNLRVVAHEEPVLVYYPIPDNDYYATGG